MFVPDLVFRMIDLVNLTVVFELSCKAFCVPTEVQLTEDRKYAVTNNVLRPEQGSLGLFRFILDGSEGNPSADGYEFRKGKKYPNYRPTGTQFR